MLLLAAGAAYQARASQGGTAATARAAAAAAPFTSIRVCGTDKIPYRGKSCARDLRSTGLVFKEIDCSVRVTVRRRSTFSASILYKGALQYIAHTVLKPGRHNELVGVRVNPAKMPGGKYTCAFRLGRARTTVSFQTRGPSGEFLGASVCVTPARRRGFCRADAAPNPIASPSSLMCGGVFVGFTGKSWGVRIVRLTKSKPSLVGQYAAKHLPGPISEQWVAFKARTTVGKYRPAKYSCLFYAAGKQVAEHTFTVK